MALPTVFEVRAEAHGYTYLGRDGTPFAVATRFGGRWRVSDADGETQFWLAPLGVAGTDDVEVVSAGAFPVGSVVRDRRRPGHWQLIEPTARPAGEVVIDTDGELVVMADDVVALVGAGDVGANVLCRGRVQRLAPTLVFALPLLFLTNGVLVPALARTESL
jgi:hypothetical protein